MVVKRQAGQGAEGRWGKAGATHLDIEVQGYIFRGSSVEAQRYRGTEVQIW